MGSWLRSRRPGGGPQDASRCRSAGGDRPAQVVVVTRDGCHLCEEMLAVVRAAAVRRPGALAEVRVLDLDLALADGRVAPEQHARWTTLVPVLMVDGEEVAHHRVAPEEAAKALGAPRR